MQRAVRWFGLEIYVYIYSWGCPCKKLGVSFYEDPAMKNHGANIIPCDLIGHESGAVLLALPPSIQIKIGITVCRISPSLPLLERSWPPTSPVLLPLLMTLTALSP